MEKKDLSKIKWGEIYTCDLGTMKGSVQCGIRPVLVVQTNKLNCSSPTVVVAVITSVRRRYCFSYPVRNELWTQRTVYGNA